MKFVELDDNGKQKVKVKKGNNIILASCAICCLPLMAFLFAMWYFQEDATKGEIVEADKKLGIWQTSMKMLNSVRSHEEMPEKKKKKNLLPQKEESVEKVDEYVEPTNQEMSDLFNKVHLPQGFQTFGADIIVLDVSLVEYRKLFYDQDGPMFGGDYLTEKHKNNQVTEQSKWLIPPSEDYKTFFGYDCRAQRDQSWVIHESDFYQYMPIDVTHLACDRHPNSFIIGEKIKKYGQWTTYDEYYLTFALWEARSADNRSNKVALRYSAQFVWLQEPMVPFAGEYYRQKVEDGLKEDALKYKQWHLNKLIKWRDDQREMNVLELQSPLKSETERQLEYFAAYNEPGPKQMRDLFRDVKMPKVYSQYGSDIQILPISLNDYFSLWWESTDNSPEYADKFYMEKNLKNKIVGEKTNWMSPPKDQFRTFMGLKCQKQRDRKWRVFMNQQYPDVAQDVITVLCAPLPTSFLIANVFKKSGVPHGEDYVVFTVWEARTPDKKSNQVALRFSAQLYWVDKPAQSVADNIQLQVDNELKQHAAEFKDWNLQQIRMIKRENK